MALVSVNYINPGVDCLLNKNCIKILSEVMCNLLIQPKLIFLRSFYNCWQWQRVTIHEAHPKIQSLHLASNALLCKIGFYIRNAVSSIFVCEHIVYVNKVTAQLSPRPVTSWCLTLFLSLICWILSLIIGFSSLGSSSPSISRQESL